MASLPHDPSDAVDTQHQRFVMPAVRSGAEFDEVVRDFERVAGGFRIDHPCTADLRELCRQVAAVTTEIFPDVIMVEVRGDPEIADELHFTFNVAATGTTDDIVGRNNRWRRELRRLLGARAELFCLSVDVR